MASPILNQIGTVFIPVSDIEKARDWYCDFLGLDNDGEIQFDHLYVIPAGSIDIVLDSKIYSKDSIFKVPSFHLNTQSIEQAYQYMKSKGIKIISEIQNDHFFNFEDPDGNVLMVCE